MSQNPVPAGTVGIGDSFICNSLIMAQCSCDYFSFLIRKYGLFLTFNTHTCNGESHQSVFEYTLYPWPAYMYWPSAKYQCMDICNLGLDLLLVVALESPNLTTVCSVQERKSDQWFCLVLMMLEGGGMLPCSPRDGFPLWADGKPNRSVLEQVGDPD